MSRGAIIVTGGAGYIGSHACKALAKAGFLPVALDNLSRGFRELVKFGPLEQGDIRDSEFLDAVFSRHHPIGVMHFAALAYVPESVSDPARYWDNNVTGTISLLAAMQRHSLPPLVFSSTCAVYGHVAGTVDEHHPIQPISPYGHSKWVSECILADYRKAYELRAVAMRYFNVAGCDAEGEVGELHDPEPHVIPRLLRTALGLEPEFTVYGLDYATDDGSCVRDYIHVSDLADAHVLALEKLLAGAPVSPVFNLSNERGYSVLELIKAAERVTGIALLPQFGARRAGDPASVVGKAGLAKAELGWVAQCTDIEHMIQTAWAWQQARADAL
jgi:UDP-arabinose 4-epimerase